MSGGADEQKLPELPIIQQGNVAQEKNVESMEAESSAAANNEDPADKEVVDSELKQKPIKLKIAGIATPILINRCKQTLKKFIKDEKKVGSVGMPKSRIAEIVFILDKLRDLDCYP